MGLLLFLLFWISGVCVQYVRVNTVHREWKQRRKAYASSNYEMCVTPTLAVWFSWFAFVAMNTKRFLDKRFINKQK